MRQKPIKPCDCKICFFCKEGMTNGIYHARGNSREKKTKSSSENNCKRKQGECSTIRESFPDSRYCGMCYRKTVTAFPNMNTEQRKNMVYSL